MAWNNWLLTKAQREKLNPAQEEILLIEGKGSIASKEIVRNYTAYYEYLEVVNRGVNMIVDDVSEIGLSIGEQISDVEPVVTGVRGKTLLRLLNREPNPFQDISTFRRNLIIDFIIDGNIFIYFDGVHMYHMPANHMVIEPDEKTYVKGYKFNETKSFRPNEIIHIKENSFDSIYRGTSRLRASRRTMLLLERMRIFQDNFFKNGAIPGLVIKSPNHLSDKIKARMIQNWMATYRPDGGGRRPMVLDGGLEVNNLSETDFKKMAFEESITENENAVYRLLGIPPILVNGGNNANIRPNHRLYYLETIIPIIRKMTAAYERFFGWEIREDVTHIPALQPELSDQANFYEGLVNSGIITPNEAREDLGREPLEGHSEIRVPQNIAGSAVDPTQGGRPSEEGEEE